MARTANPIRKHWKEQAQKNGIKGSTFNDRITYQKMSYKEAATRPIMIPGRLKDGTFKEVAR